MPYTCFSTELFSTELFSTNLSSTSVCSLEVGPLPVRCAFDMRDLSVSVVTDAGGCHSVHMLLV